MGAKTAFAQAAEDVELLTGMRVSAKTVERMIKRNPIGPSTPKSSVQEMALDGGMVRWVTAKRKANEWKQYKAVRLNGDGAGMA